MASIFTYDPDPPRVSSPWSTPRAATPKGPATAPASNGSADREASAPEGSLSADGFAKRNETRPIINKLEAEPQEGPTEYKLHLLLRPRRSFIGTSTGRLVPGSYREQAGSLTPPTGAVRRASDSVLPHESGAATASAPAVSAAASSQARQLRLEQLTTQLLWRLQQSSPYHSSAANNLILPQLPEISSSQLIPAAKPGNLLPGLEESRGALYEIGVSDDGTFVGLAEDELQESLTNLRAMAASLGCTVDVLRKVDVGECKWYHLVQTNGKCHRELRSGTLWVAEALVKPAANAFETETSAVEGNLHASHPPPRLTSHDAPVASHGAMLHSPLQQLRVSLTGATMSGKSSLLGSLSTATLDNGRGKSRLSLLKHRHEIASGMTSSVTQELIGYPTNATDDIVIKEAVPVINYASDNVSAWTDIHERAERGRLVFLSDSAGHPRYRRTTLRGLVGWAPHWTLLCIPADNVEDTSGKSGSTPPPQEVLGTAAADVDLSQTHLELCLKLQLPLVVVITKLDLASKVGLRQTLSKLLSTLKAAGRKPGIVPDTGSAASEDDLQRIPIADIKAARKVTASITDDHLSSVPILLTSAVKGVGIGKLHALLRELPIALPDPHNTIARNPSPTSPSPLFHIEDIYTKPPSPTNPSNPLIPLASIIISGYLRHGTLTTNSTLLLGPFSTDLSPDDEDPSPDSSDAFSHRRRRSQYHAAPTSRSFPGANKLQQTSSRRGAAVVWQTVRVVSLRHLRRPVRVLREDQVGTIGIEVVSDSDAGRDEAVSRALVRVRKGMVLGGGAMPAPRRVFEARFANLGTGVGVGSVVVVYVASVRAGAKVIALAVEDGGQGEDEEDVDEEDGFGFGFDEPESGGKKNGKGPGSVTVISFQFLASREFVETGAKVLVMPGGGPVLAGGTERGEKGVAGLEGFVGTVC